MVTTIYDINIRYKLDDRASRGMKTLGRSADRTADSVGRVDRTLSRMAKGAVAYFGIRGASKALVGFNSNIEQAQIKMAGLLQLNTGRSFNSQLRESKELFGALQKRAAKSVGTTSDMVEMASMLTRPVTAAGLGMKDLEEITAGATVAAKAFGIEAGQAALDLEQALMGTLGKKDRFARALLEPMGYGTDTFNKKSAKERADILRRAFQQDGIKNMAAAQEKSFSGMLSTLQDSAERFFGLVGEGLFSELKKALDAANKWVDQNQGKIREFAKDLGETLVEGFKYLGEIVKMMIKHRHIFMAMGGAFVGMKAGRMLGGGVQGIAGLFQRNNVELKTFGDKLNFAAGRLGIYTAALGAGIAAVHAIGQNMVKRADASWKARAALDGMYTASKKMSRARGIDRITASKNTLNSAVNRGFINSNGSLNRGKLLSMAGEIGYADTGRDIYGNGVAFTGAATKAAIESAKNIDQLAQMLDRLAANGHSASVEFERLRKSIAAIASAQSAGSVRSVGESIYATLSGVQGGLRRQASSFQDKSRGVNNVNVKISRVEVASDDPDRFVIGLAGIARKAVTAPSQARGVLRE